MQAIVDSSRRIKSPAQTLNIELLQVLLQKSHKVPMASNIRLFSLLACRMELVRSKYCKLPPNTHQQWRDLKERRCRPFLAITGTLKKAGLDTPHGNCTTYHKLNIKVQAAWLVLRDQGVTSDWHAASYATKLNSNSQAWRLTAFQASFGPWCLAHETCCATCVSQLLVQDAWRCKRNASTRPR